MIWWIAWPSDQLGLGAFVVWSSQGAGVPLAAVPVEDRISIGTIFGAQSPEPRIGGM